MQLSNKKSNVESINILENPIKQLFDVDYSWLDNRKLPSLLGRLHKDFAVAAKMIWLSQEPFTEAVSQIVQWEKLST